MNINGKWYSETEAMAYIKELEDKLRDREDEADNNNQTFKVNDEVEAAYRQGYAEGVKSEAARQLYDCIDTLVHEISKALTDCIKRAKIEVGFAKETEKLQEQHWNECRQIAQYDDELRKCQSQRRQG